MLSKNNKWYFYDNFIFWILILISNYLLIQLFKKDRECFEQIYIEKHFYLKLNRLYVIYGSRKIDLWLTDLLTYFPLLFSIITDLLSDNFQLFGKLSYKIIFCFQKTTFFSVFKSIIYYFLGLPKYISQNIIFWIGVFLEQQSF